MLRVGVDCEEISRFRRLPYDRNEKFYRRIFTEREIEYCRLFRDPYPRFAVRFAAKEAVIKALNSQNIPSYTEIEVKKDKAKRPYVFIGSNRCKKAARLTISLSLAHSTSYAIAFVIAADNRNHANSIKRVLKKSVSYTNKKISKRLKNRVLK